MEYYPIQYQTDKLLHTSLFKVVYKKLNKIQINDFVKIIVKGANLNLFKELKKIVSFFIYYPSFFNYLLTIFHYN